MRSAYGSSTSSGTVLGKEGDNEEGGAIEAMAIGRDGEVGGLEETEDEESISHIAISVTRVIAYL